MDERYYDRDDWMNDHNTRAAEIWEILKPNVDFSRKTVFDIGCGHGDLLWRYYNAGAKRVLGIDCNGKIAMEARERARDHTPRGAAITVLIADIEDWLNWDIYDIIVSLSVLPYIKDPISLLEKMYTHSRDATIIECQYTGDGPGYYGVHNDMDMQAVLESIWEEAVAIGKTKVEIRDKYRTIWKCTK